MTVMYEYYAILSHVNSQNKKKNYDEKENIDETKQMLIGGNKKKMIKIIPDGVLFPLFWSEKHVRVV